jgi:hypothetical protein
MRLPDVPDLAGEQIPRLRAGIATLTAGSGTPGTSSIWHEGPVIVHTPRVRRRRARGRWLWRLYLLDPTHRRS